MNVVPAEPVAKTAKRTISNWIYYGVCALLGITVGWCAATIDDVGRWTHFRVVLETLAGATWPAECQKPSECSPRLAFAIAVGLRTAINLAVIVSFALGVLFALSSDGRSLMATLTMTLASRMRLHEKRLLNAVLTVIEQRHPDVLDEDDLAAINATAANMHAEIENEIAKQQEVSARHHQ